MSVALLDDPVVVIGALLVVGAVFRMLAWTELRAYNWFEIFMREHPPFEDLAPAGQVLMILPWLFTFAAVGVIVAVYMLPNFSGILR
jgi:hypothetical protein